MLVSVQDMIGWGLLVLPMIVLAWAGSVYIETTLERRRYERYQQFYRILRDLAREDASQAEKMAAAYELRQYREFRDIMARIFSDGQLKPEDAHLINDQLKESARVIGVRTDDKKPSSHSM
ncbi:MAG: hypothetical protein QM645_08780 [Asticcacaulis sp.]